MIIPTIQRLMQRGHSVSEVPFLVTKDDSTGKIFKTPGQIGWMSHVSLVISVSVHQRYLKVSSLMP